MISKDSKNSGSESMELSEEGPSDIAGPPDDYNWHIFGWDRDRTSSMLKIEHYTGVKVLQAGGFKTAIGDQPMLRGGKYYFEISLLKGDLLKIGICKQDSPFEQNSFCDDYRGWAVYNGELRHGMNGTQKKFKSEDPKVDTKFR